MEFVERGDTNSAELFAVAEEYLAPILAAGVDTLVLGCTHYPLLTGVISYVVGDAVTLVSSAEETAKDVYRELAGGRRLPRRVARRRRITASSPPATRSRSPGSATGSSARRSARSRLLSTPTSRPQPLERSRCMKLTVIGSAGTFPGPASGCSSYLLEEDGFRLLLDVGNGSTGALQEACGLLGPDAVVVSHLHGDHYLDLVTYTYARRYHPDGAAPVLPVYGPSKIHDAMLAGATARAIDALLDEVYDFHPVDHDQVVGDRPVRGRPPAREPPGRDLRHADLAPVAARSPTAPTPASATRWSTSRTDADLFLCEASYLDGEDNPPDIHLTGREAARARGAGRGAAAVAHPPGAVGRRGPYSRRGERAPTTARSR